MTPPKLILILSENWTLTSAARPAFPRAVRGRGRRRRVRRRDGQRARRARARRRCRRSPVEPARLRPAREPGSRDAVAQLAGAAVRRRGRDHPAAAGGRCHHPAPAPPAARGQGPGDARSALRGTAGRPADGELAPSRVRRARRPVRVAGARSSTSTWRPGTCCGATHRRRSTGRTTASTTCTSSRSRSAPKGRRSGSAAARSTTGWSTASSRTATASTPWAVRRPRICRDCARRWPRRAGASTSSRWSAGRAACSPIASSVADLAQALSSIPEQVAAGFTSICIKPSQFIDDAERFGPFCREVVERVSALVG